MYIAEIASKSKYAPQVCINIHAYSVLAKIPALLCRLGRVPYDRAFGALIVRSLSIAKKFD